MRKKSKNIWRSGWGRRYCSGILGQLSMILSYSQLLNGKLGRSPIKFAFFLFFLLKHYLRKKINLPLLLLAYFIFRVDNVVPDFCTFYYLYLFLISDNIFGIPAEETIPKHQGYLVLIHPLTHHFQLFRVQSLVPTFHSRLFLLHGNTVNVVLICFVSWIDVYYTV